MTNNNFLHQPSIFMSAIENEKIMQIDYAGRPVKEIGVTMAQYQEALKVVAGYKEKLVEAGILKKEKTVQELQEEQMAMMQTIMKEVNDLKEQMNKYESRGNTSDIEELLTEGKSTNA